MSQNTPVPTNSGLGSNVTTCANCHSPMPAELRFCRNCGYRLGEGPAEYTETVRFQNGRAATSGNSAAGPENYSTTYGLGGGPVGTAVCGGLKRRRRRMSGMSWI